jgi:PTH1 family peptidyl-tRNA hydrolase
MRIRVGVGEKPKGYDLADYVLGHYSDEEKTVMDKSFLTAAEAAVFIMNEDIDKAMNKYN